jgi:hypothetical protein
VISPVVTKTLLIVGCKIYIFSFDVFNFEAERPRRLFFFFMRLRGCLSKSGQVSLQTRLIHR